MKRSPGNRRGAIMVLVAVCMVALIGLLALLIDGGMLQYQKRLAQTAADAGALAGAIEVHRNRPDSVVASVRSETSRNGFTHLVGGDSVTVTYPGTGPAIVGATYVNVTVQHRARALFAGIFGQGTMTVRARSTGGIVLSEYCIVILDPNGSAALSIQQWGTVTAEQCNIAVNSNSATAVTGSGQASVTAQAIGVVGGVTGSTFNPTPQLGISPVADPMAWMPLPNVPNTCDRVDMAVTTAMTLSPGTYCGGITVNNGQATLLPGLYILRGGGLEVKSGSSSLRSTGAGVSFYNTSAPAGGGYGPITFWANSSINVSANTDPYSALPGVLFYSDPASPNMTNVFKAGSSAVMNGTMYFPTQTVSFESAASNVINGALVAFRLSMQNNTSIKFTGYNPIADLDALRRPTIVE